MIDSEDFPSRYKELYPYIRDKKVLHLGCVDHDWRNSLTPNWIHRFIEQYAGETTGLDYLKDAVEILSNNGHNIVYGDAECFDLHRKFDVIFAGELIEHLQNHRGFLLSCKKHMASDSKLILSTPNSFGLRYFISNCFNRYLVNVEHACWFDKATLMHLLNSNGFCIDYFKFIGLDRNNAGKVKGFALRQLERRPQTMPVLFVVARLGEQATDV